MSGSGEGVRSELRRASHAGTLGVVGLIKNTQKCEGQRDGNGMCRRGESACRRGER